MLTIMQKKDRQTLYSSLRTVSDARMHAASTMQYSLNTLITLFLIASVFGWTFETVLYLINDGVLTNPGVLYGPWLPIYGVSSVLIVVLLRGLSEKPVVLFFSIMILCGAAELITGNLLELATGAKWWDYSNFALSIGSYTCLEALVVFGVGGMMLVYILAPTCERILQQVPLRTQRVFLGILLSIFFVDMSYSFMNPNYAATDLVHTISLNESL